MARRPIACKAIHSVRACAVKRRVVEAFLAAARDGDFDGLLALLHPDVELHADAVAAGGRPVLVRGSADVASRASMFAANAAHAEPALIDGTVGVVVAPEGRLALVVRIAVADDVIVGIDIEADPNRLRDLELAVLE